jgi:hypothetical protein
MAVLLDLGCEQDRKNSVVRAVRGLRRRVKGAKSGLVHRLFDHLLTDI